MRQPTSSYMLEGPDYRGGVTMSILRRRESAQNPFPSTVNPFSDRLAGAAVGNTWTLGFWEAWVFAEAEVVIAKEALALRLRVAR